VARSDPPDLILLDIMMPDLDGYHVAEQLKKDVATRMIPIVMVTALDDRGTRLIALDKGAVEFLSKPVDRIELSVRVRNLLKLKEYQDFLENYNRILKDEVEQRTRDLQNSYVETIYTMTSAAEYKDEETGTHVRRISHYCKELAQTLGMTAEYANTLYYASPMHDIGKIGIPDHVLFKPASFTPEEWKVMKTHAELGAKILARGTSPYLRMGAEIALNHHERWDGSGYPNGLKGEDIPFSARIMTIGDVYDALRSKRPYKAPFPHERACSVITAGDGRTSPDHFDPHVLAAFRNSAHRFREIFEALVD